MRSHYGLGVLVLLVLATGLLVFPIRLGHAQARVVPEVQAIWGASYILYGQTDEEPPHPVCGAIAFEVSAAGTYLTTTAHCLVEDRYFIGADVRDVEIFPALPQAANAERDIAVMFVAGQQLNWVPLGTDPAIGEAVLSVIAPGMWNRVLAPGLIAAAPDTSEARVMPVYLVSGVGGDSGSGLYCVEQKALCGIVKGFWVGVPGYVGAVPVSGLKALQWR